MVLDQDQVGMDHLLQGRALVERLRFVRGGFRPAHDVAEGGNEPRGFAPLALATCDPSQVAIDLPTGTPGAAPHLRRAGRG